MEEKLRLVIDKIIIPHFKDLDYELYEVPRLKHGEYRRYHVRYLFKDKNSMQRDFTRVAEETITLFEMLAPDEETVSVIPGLKEK